MGVPIAAALLVAGAVLVSVILYIKRGRNTRGRDDTLRLRVVAKQAPAYLHDEVPYGAHRCPLCARHYNEATLFCPVDGTHLVRWESAAPPHLCPTCQRAYPDGLGTCPHDFDELMPHGYMKANIKAPSQAPPAVAKVCPCCDQRYAPNQTFCREDGTKLMVLN